MLELSLWKTLPVGRNVQFNSECARFADCDSRIGIDIMYAANNYYQLTYLYQGIETGSEITWFDDSTVLINYVVQCIS